MEMLVSGGKTEKSLLQPARVHNTRLIACSKVKGSRTINGNPTNLVSECRNPVSGKSAGAASSACSCEHLSHIITEVVVLCYIGKKIKSISNKTFKRFSILKNGALWGYKEAVGL